MMLVGRDGRIALVNGQVEKLFGYVRAELVGMEVSELVPQRFRAGHPHSLQAFFAAPAARPMGAGRDLYGLRKDGSELPIEIGLNPLETPEGWFVLSSIVDITERRRAAEQLERSLREKETLLREIHHQVKNNLQVISSLLRLQASRIDDARWTTLLDESQARVEAIALIHERLYLADDVARVDFAAYLREIGRNMVAAFAPDGVEVAVDAVDLELPVDSAVPCGLVVNELVTNALKHGYPDGRRGTVRIAAARDHDQLEVLVHDDGAGYGDAPGDRSGMGLTLVHALARQLGGAFSLETTPGTGTAARLTFEVPS
jgi:PAS domain S-box-containing protein